MDGSCLIFKKQNKILLTVVTKNIALKLSDILGNNFKKYTDLEFINIDQVNCTLEFDLSKHINDQVVSKNINQFNGVQIVGEFKLNKLMLKSKNKTNLFDTDFMDLSLKISDNITQIDIKPFKLIYPQAIVSLDFKDNQIQNKTRLQFAGKNIHIGQAKNIALLLLKNNKITKNIFNILHNGIASDINVSFHDKNLKNLFNKNNFALSGTIQNGLIAIPKTNLKASDVEGNAGIKNGVLNINTKQGVIQGANIKKGTLSVDLLNYNGFPFKGEFDLDIDLAIIPETLISLLPDTFLSKELSMVHDVTGRADAKLKLSMETPSNDLIVEIKTHDFSTSGFYDRIPWKIDLKKINFIYKPDIVHLKNINCIVHNNIIDDLEIFLDFKDQPDMKIISGSGMINLHSITPWLLSFNKINDLIAPLKNAKGKIHIKSINLSGPILKSNQWKYNVIGTGIDIDLVSPFNTKKIEKMSFKYNISDEFLNFNNIHIKHNNLLPIEPVLIEIDKNSNINIKSKTIKIDNFDSDFKNIRTDNFNLNYLFNKPVKLKTDKLKIKNLTFSNVDTKIILNKNGYDIKVNKAFLCDLETNGYIKLKNQMLQMSLPVKAIDKPDIQVLLNCLFNKNEFMTGKYSLTCDLSSNSQKKDFLKNINGSLNFIAQNGRIHKITLISRILSVINISKILKGKSPDITQHGFEYNKVTIQADIQKGIIHLTKAIIDGKDITLVFKGWIDPFNDAMDLTCLVSPFKTVDLIIENIPVVNKIFGKSLVSIPVKAKGKLLDPVIIPLEPSAIGDGLINILTTILESPLRLWNVIYGE